MMAGALLLLLACVGIAAAVRLMVRASERALQRWPDY
jgi:hypothetical protein